MRAARSASQAQTKVPEKILDTTFTRTRHSDRVRRGGRSPHFVAMARDTKAKRAGGRGQHACVCLSFICVGSGDFSPTATRRQTEQTHTSGYQAWQASAHDGTGNRQVDGKVGVTSSCARSDVISMGD